MVDYSFLLSENISWCKTNKRCADRFRFL